MNQTANNLPIEIEPLEVQQLRKSEQGIELLDCREPFETDIVSVEGALLMPMGEIPGRLDELKEQASGRIVVYCHHGMRSLQVANWLRSQGMEAVQSMTGGIDRWAVEVDSALTRY